ncbi:hypothetical protein BSE24067_04333 [Burkholderia seminalis]|nr:hypothetical protein BSE24067_04333 [Burkholderia seminalis]
MYHCVPSTISGDSQMSAFRWKWTITMTNTGNSRLAGNAARNCASGWIFSASFGRSPISTPSGTQTSDAIAISTSTRSSVMSPSTSTWPTSPIVTPVATKLTTRHATYAVSRITNAPHTMSPRRDARRDDAPRERAPFRDGTRSGIRAACDSSQPAGTSS